MKLAKRQLGSTWFQTTVLGIGDLADRSVPLAKHRKAFFAPSPPVAFRLE